MTSWTARLLTAAPRSSGSKHALPPRHGFSELAGLIPNECRPFHGCFPGMSFGIRSFLGYPLEKNAALDRLCTALPDGWQPVHSTDRHLTLVFLGDIDHQQQHKVWHRTQQTPPPTGQFPALELSGFGHPRSPRTLALTLDAAPIADWIQQYSPAICSISNRHADRRPPRPHVSLAYWRGHGAAKFARLPAVRNLRVALLEWAMFERIFAPSGSEHGPRYRCRIRSRIR